MLSDTALAAYMKDIEYMEALAAVDPASLRAFIKILYAASYMWHVAYLPKTVISQISGWNKSAAELVKAFKINKEHFNKIVDMVSKSKYDMSFDAAMEGVGEDIKKIIGDSKESSSIGFTDLDILKALSTYLWDGTDTTYSKLDKYIAYLKEPELSKLFVPETKKGEHGDVIGKMKALVKKMTGRSDVSLTSEESGKLNASKGNLNTLYKEYVKLRTEARKVFINTLTAIVRSSGDKPIEINDAKAKLKAKGIVLDYLPVGFVGKVGINHHNKIALYTTNNLEINGGLPRGGSTIVMNPAYDPASDNTWVYGAKHPEHQDRIEYWTFNFNKDKRDQKDKAVMEFINNVDPHINRWSKDILQDKDSTKQVLATIVYLIYATQARIGSPRGNANGQATDGFSTLKVSSTKILGNTIKFSYKGKMGIPQKHEFKATNNVGKKILSIVAAQLGGKKPGDYVWTDPSTGNRIYDRLITAYFKTGTNLKKGTGVHIVRKVKGTMLMQSLINSSNFKFNPKKAGSAQKQAELHHMDNLVKVGHILGHKKDTGETIGTTAGRAYVVPEIQKDFFMKHGLRPPPWLLKLLKEKD